jgi:hypothetical protein
MDIIEMLNSKLTLEHGERSIFLQASFQTPLPTWITGIYEKVVAIQFPVRGKKKCSIK